MPALTAGLESDGLIAINVHGEVGANYTVESSQDLVRLEQWAQFVATNPVTPLTDRPNGGVMFYWVVKTAPASASGF